MKAPKPRNNFEGELLRTLIDFGSENMASEKVSAENKSLAIVLGQSLSPSGALPKLFITRLLRGLELLESGQVDHILICGGDVIQVGITEAQAGKNFLLEKCSSDMDASELEKKILLETESSDTISNAIFALPILRGRGFRSVFLVTSNFHMPRSKYAFRAVFGAELFEKIVASPAEDTFEEKNEREMPCQIGADVIADINEWNLQERLLHEVAIMNNKMEAWLSSLGIEIPPPEVKQAVMKELAQLIEKAKTMK